VILRRLQGGRRPAAPARRTHDRSDTVCQVAEKCGQLAGVTAGRGGVVDSPVPYHLVSGRTGLHVLGTDTASIAFRQDSVRVKHGKGCIEVPTDSIRTGSPGRTLTLLPCKRALRLRHRLQQPPFRPLGSELKGETVDRRRIVRLVVEKLHLHPVTRPVNPRPGRHRTAVAPDVPPPGQAPHEVLVQGGLDNFSPEDVVYI